MGTSDKKSTGDDPFPKRKCRQKSNVLWNKIYTIEPKKVTFEEK